MLESRDKHIQLWMRWYVSRFSQDLIHGVAELVISCP